MISELNFASLSEQYPKFEDITCSLRAISRQPKEIFKETKEVIAIARKFNEEVVRPYALELDRKVHEDPDFLAEEFIRKSGEWGFFTLWIPRLFGGKGYNLPSFSYFAEEIASACTAMANLIGVHYLGIATLIATWNTKMIMKVCNDVIEGEKSGTPCLLSIALTEPDAGTDVEEVELMDKGAITCHAQKVKGGYLVNGRKVFISNGHLSNWHMLFSFSETNKPSENLVMLAVKTGAKGFSFGRIERKMGQKGCAASELIFEDCFVGDENVCINPVQSEKLSRRLSETTMQLIDYVFSASRAGVCALGAGVARGAFEEALKFASETEVEGKLLINHEWAQSMLAEMYKNIAISRLAYVEANYANELYGIYKFLHMKPIYYLIKYMPRSLLRMILPVLNSEIGTWLFRKLHCDIQTDDEICRTSGWASLAKFTGTDAGVKNAQMAMELMGQAGLRHDRRVEKHLRDAKLMQIYEGTNQLNRLNLFKCLIAGAYPQTRLFDE
mmetsp:Transcript_21743/g.10192  ORF Transcript_21743/g.10192 Transcript_21743/m.10192 type:complete len:500 (-) Transcript_21743:3054-4553(-)